VLCNWVLKLLLRRALELEADCLATGHYARIVGDAGGYALRKGLDPAKDQSYFLFTLNQEQMRRVLFPLGGMTKEEVRGFAARFSLRVAEKMKPGYLLRSRRRLCALPRGGARQQAARRRDRHVRARFSADLGTYRYTITSVAGWDAWPQPLYVVGIDAENRRVLVGEQTWNAGS
jgi:tRNA-specific 2-thiouridylase